MEKKFLLIILCLTVVSCYSEQNISEESFGFWVNVEPEYNNWWEISNNQVINYGTGNTNTCIKNEVKIIGKNRLNIDFGNKAVADLEVVDGIMVIKVGDLLAKHRSVSKTEICKRDGAYFEGAPYEK